MPSGSSGIEIFCGPDEFWLKLKLVIEELHLVCFKRYQRTGEIVPLTLLTVSEPLEWQWDLWIAKAVPEQFCSQLPAECGWVLVTSPRVNKDKSITKSIIAAKYVWLDKETKELKCNEELKTLIGKIRRRFQKNTIVRKPANSVSMRYTLNALELQNQGWSFIAAYGGGPAYRLPELTEPR